MTGGRVVVLGPTGRNFAAGMSGGIAYVLDEDGTFARRCNMELVDFEEIGPLDARELRELIAEHLKWTGIAGRRARAGRLGADPAPLRQGDAARLQARARRGSAARADARRGHRRPRERALAESRPRPTEARPWARSAASSRSSASASTSATRASACATTSATSTSSPRTSCAGRAAAAWTAACRSATRAARSGNLIPDWNDLVYRGEWRAAIDQLHATNNFPEFTGLICPAPCESACVLDINDDPVTIEQIELGDRRARLAGGLDRARAARGAHAA